MVRGIAAATLLLAASSAAQSYRFSVPDFMCVTALESTGTLSIYYEITFECEPGAHEIDIVDIGLPVEGYDRSSFSAEIDGHGIDDIRESTVLPIGIEVHLGSESIAPGRTGVLEVSGSVDGVVFRDTTDPSRASLEFTPTWFDPSLLTGTSDFLLRFMFPPGADSAGVAYTRMPFTSAYAYEGRMVYEWETERQVSSQYLVGVSFPGNLVTCEILDSSPAGGAGPITHAQGSHGETGACCVVGAIPAILLGAGLLAALSARKRRQQYLKPSLGVEGVGIKRGLTVPQVGMLLGEKLDRVMILVVHGLLRKGALSLSGEDGKMTFEKPIPSMEGLQEYEKVFLSAVKPGRTGKDALDPAKLREMFVGMVRDVEERMKGFSLKETREYYRSIMTQAWEQVRAAGSESVSAVLSEQLPWLLLENRIDERTRQMPELRSILIYPVNMGGHYRPLVQSGGGMTIGQFCSNVAGGLEHMASGFVGSFDGIAASVTSVTNPVPVSRSYGSSHSGGGCACACACAGCACACAGGGR